MKILNELVGLANKANAAGQGTPEMVEFRVTANPDNILAIAEAFRALECEVHELRREKQNDNRYQELLKLGTAVVYECDEAVRRAEAAEAKVKELEQEQAEHDEQIASLQGKFDLALAGLRSKTSRCDKAEAKLAELEKQEPMGRVDRGEANDNNEYPDVRVVCLHEQADWINFQDGTELFLRPAPAINLADLVPDEVVQKQAICWFRSSSLAGNYRDGWNDCRATMLRNIEEAK